MAKCNSIFGYPVIATEYMRENEQARKHKKKRTNKKWLKRYGMRSVPSKKMVIFDGRIYCHPKLFDKIKENVDEYEDDFCSYGERREGE